MAKGIVLPQGFDANCTGTYTANNGDNVKVSLVALVELMKSIPEPPRIFRMDFKLLGNNLLPPNTIMMSADIADALEEALKGAGRTT